MQFINELKQNIVKSRYIAARLANKEQLFLYYKTGKLLSEKIVTQRWGGKVIQQISEDLQKQMPGLRGFSYRNLKNMRQFYQEYSDTEIGQSLTAQLKLTDNQTDIIAPSLTAQLEAFAGISFSHHILLLNKCRSFEKRLFYMEMAASEFWSVNILEHKIDSELFEKRGKLPNNFSSTLTELKPSATQVFNDEYLFDYMNLSSDDNEKEVENQIVANIKDFLLRMGKGFSFIGNQFRIELDGEEFFIDLLFFNRHLQSLVAFELKQGKFKPAYAGQLNFYLNVLDEKIRLPHENPSIGIILCKEKSNTVVEFSVRSIDKAMGVATYKTSKIIPDEMKGILPDANELAGLL